WTDPVHPVRVQHRALGRRCDDRALLGPGDQPALGRDVLAHALRPGYEAGWWTRLGRGEQRAPAGQCGRPRAGRRLDLLRAGRYDLSFDRGRCLVQTREPGVDRIGQVAVDVDVALPQPGDEVARRGAGG